MKRLVTYSTMLSAALVCGLLSCSSQKGILSLTESTKDKGSTTTTVLGHDVSILLRQEGCPDVADFFTRLRALPSDTGVRRHTISLQPSDLNEDGSKPRTNFLSVLAFASFEFSELKMAEFRNEIGAIEQNSCANVRITEPNVGAQDWTIRAFSPTSIRLGTAVDVNDPTKDSMTLEFEWVAARELRIRSRYSAMDFCPNYKSIQVEKTQSLQWGPADFLTQSATAEVDASYLEHAMRPLAAHPSALAVSVSSVNGTAGLDINSDGPRLVQAQVSDLRRLRESFVRQDMKVCPYRAKPPTGDEPPPPEPDAAPTPTPTPDTGTTPEPVPEPEV
ncbi:MAG: hypothetical protein NDI61_01045 [Bdellovibrionaceae bacterium]|nr:hypothetical protein [Pseudobdellovibrionaceae bacterium]